jgi:hypothetical protein
LHILHLAFCFYFRDGPRCAPNFFVFSRCCPQGKTHLVLKKGFNRNGMKKRIVQFVMMVSCCVTLHAQNNVIATGNWDATSTWQSGNIADVVSENVAFTSGSKTVTVQGASNYTVGTVALGSDGNLTIAGTLNIGNSGNSKNLTGNASRAFSITGTLIIWGNVTLGDGASWNTSGNVEIKGNLTMGNNASIINSGNFKVGGNWNSGTSTAVITSGPINVIGDVVVSTSSSLTNSATFKAHSCSGPSSFCNNVLPVILTKFESQAEPRQIVLSWTTTSEINFDRFEIQRSADGRAFETIGSVKGKGFNFNDLETNYSFSDLSPIAGKNYYRLKSVDYDGYFEHSKIILATFEAAKLISVYPNPSNGVTIGILLNFVPDEGSAVEIYDNLGVLHDTFPLDKSGSSEFVFRDRLNNGHYFLKFVSGNFLNVLKFTVR